MNQNPTPSPNTRQFLSPWIVLGVLLFALLLGTVLLILSVNAAASRMRGPSSTQAAQMIAQSTPTPFLPIVTVLPAVTPGPAGGAASVPTLAVLPSVTKTLPAQPTPQQEDWAAGGRYIVQPGDNLETIGVTLGVTADQLRAANFMLGDAVLTGQALLVPDKEGLAQWRWVYASLDKELADTYYPLSLDTERFRLHYMANTYPSVDPQSVADMMQRGLLHVENVFGKPLSGTFHIYVAGTLYEPPNRYLRGRSFSLDRKVFFLHDGSGDADNQQYLAAHELTHLYAWNSFGQPYSFLLSEGAAVYSGMRIIEESSYLPIRAFCAGYKKEGWLPVLAPKNELEDWRGHNNNLVNYYSAGCLVGYLLETYGVEKFGQVYHTLDYPAVYGKTLEQLEFEWKASITSEDIPPELDTARLVSSVNRFVRANQVFYDTFNASPASLLAYRELDKARLALLSADFDSFDARMDHFDAAFSP